MDLDGVLTSTATVHEAAWKQLFDSFLGSYRGPSTNTGPFTPDDYLRFVDGRPRRDGIRVFLESRGVTIPEGRADDPPTAATVNGLATRKNAAVSAAILKDGVPQFPSSRGFLELVRRTGILVAVVSASENARSVLVAAGLIPLIDTIVDGIVADREHLAGKPAPDTFLHAASLLHVLPQHAAVFEDALAGVQAGRAGAFGWVVGVDRSDQSPNHTSEHGSALRAAGADIVISDLAAITTEEA